MRQEQPGPGDWKDRQTRGKDAGPRRPRRSGTALRPPRPGTPAEAEWRRRRSLGLRDAPTVPVPECRTCSSAAVARWRRGRALRCAPARAAAMETGLCVAEEGPERAGAAGPAPARGEGGRGGRGGREGGTRLRGRGWEGESAGVPSVPRVSLGSEPLKHAALLGDSRPVAIRVPCLLQSRLLCPHPPPHLLLPRHQWSSLRLGTTPGVPQAELNGARGPAPVGWLRLGHIEASNVLFEIGGAQGTAPLDWQQADHSLIPFPRVRAAEP